MPTYIYKAVTSSGLVVRNRVEANSKQNLLRTLKENDLMPITIEQILQEDVSRKDPVTVTETAGIVQEDKNQPLEEEMLRQRFFRLGDTPFEWESLEIETWTLNEDGTVTFAVYRPTQETIRAVEQQ